MQIMIPPQVKYIITALEKRGYNAYVVGGCVRDSLMGATPKDWDVCTSATPEEIADCFRDNKIVRTGIRFGTVTVFAYDEKGIEVTSFRTESEYSDNRRPDKVEFVKTLNEDVLRRDFTVNAMAYSLREGLIDLCGGREDIKKRLIRCVGIPAKRFEEDGLRILRALRFASVYEFKIEADTSDAIFSLKYLLKNIAKERVKAELTKMLCGKNAEYILMKYSAVIAEIIPEIRPMIGFDQQNRHHCYDVWEHTVKAIAAAPNDETVRFTLLFHDIGKPDSFTLDEAGEGHFKGHPEIGMAIAERIMQRLRFSNTEINQILLLIKHHDSICENTERSVRRRLGKLGKDTFEKLLAVQIADTSAHAVEYVDERLKKLALIQMCIDNICEAEKCCSLRTLDICGDDLINIGIPEGKRIGEILNCLLDAVIDEKCQNQKEELLEYVRLYWVNKQ